MGRAKVKMEPITNEKARQLTLKSRKKGLKKKLQELSTLCDVKVGMIMYDQPQKDGTPAEPEIWPNDPNEIRELYDMYKTQPHDDRQKRTTDLSSFFKDRNDKLEAMLMKQRKKNNEAKYPTWDPRYDDLSEALLRELACLLETKIEAAKTRLEFLKEYGKMESSTPMGTATNFYSTEFFQSLLRDNNIHELGGDDQLNQVVDVPQPYPLHDVISEQKYSEAGGLETVPPLNADYMDPIMEMLMNSQMNYDEVLINGVDDSNNFMGMPLSNDQPIYCDDTFPTPLNIMMPNHHHHDVDGGRTDQLDFMNYDPTTAMQPLLLPQYYGHGDGSGLSQMHSLPSTDDFYYETTGRYFHKNDHREL